MKGSIYLIPNTLGGLNPKDTVPDKTLNLLAGISHFIVENERTARRFLVKAGVRVNRLTFYPLNKHTPENEIKNYLTPAIEGNDMGLISEAGVPCVADPGSQIVLPAHNKGIRVIPLTGPSSVILALMASGLNGQNFAFNGYLPIKKKERRQSILNLEKRSKTLNQTQIFMETPYRNMQLIEDLLSQCSSGTYLCIGCDITLESEYIKTQTIDRWKKDVPDLNKRPAIFLIHRK